MKNVRNKKLQQLCEQELNLKDIILNFDDGLVYIYSDDDNTSNILAKADTSIIAGQGGAIKSFLSYSIDDWFNIIKNWYDNNLDINFDKKSSWIRIISAKTKKTNPKIKNIINKPNKPIKHTKNAPKPQNRAVSKRFKIKTKNSEWPHQDISLPVLEDLLSQGYNMITLVAWSGACNYCKQRNGKTMSLSNWLNQLQHEAPIFEAFHVNSYSKLKVWDKTGELDPVYVDYTGEMS